MEEINPITSTVTEKVPQDSTEIPVKVPKKILHFSDGILEEFSDEDETDNAEKPNPIYDVNEAELEWGPWFVHKAVKSSYQVLAACDYVGEGLASILGITTPKYEYEIEEFKRMQLAAQMEDGHELTDWVSQAKKLEVNGKDGPMNDATNTAENAQLKY